MTQLKTVAAAAVSVLALAGCTHNLDMARVQDFVKQTIQTQVGASVKSVSCPDHREMKQGDSFDCAVELDGGGKTSVTITQSDAAGNISLDMKQSLVKVAGVEQAIAEAIKKTSNIDATVDCGAPKFRPSVPNDTFACSAKAGAESAQYKVVIKDGKGNVSFGPATPAAAAAPDAPPADAGNE
jgi:hypothetical protein